MCRFAGAIAGDVMDGMRVTPALDLIAESEIDAGHRALNMGSVDAGEAVGRPQPAHG